MQAAKAFKIKVVLVNIIRLRLQGNTPVLLISARTKSLSYLTVL